MQMRVGYIRLFLLAPSTVVVAPCLPLLMQMRVNYMGTVNTIQAVLPGMLQRRKGRLVVVASTLGVLGFAGACWGVPTLAPTLPP